MKKNDYIHALCEGLRGLPEENIREYAQFYSEMIDDRMEEGMTEQEAVSALGSVDSAIEQVLSELPLQKLVKRSLEKRKPTVWQTVLLIMGSPLWLPLLIAAFAVILAVYAVLWSAVLCLYATVLALAAGVLASLIGLPILIFNGTMGTAVIFLGAGFMLAGIAVLLFMASNLTAKGVWALGRLFVKGIKRMFIREESRA